MTSSDAETDSKPIIIIIIIIIITAPGGAGQESIRIRARKKHRTVGNDTEQPSCTSF